MSEGLVVQVVLGLVLGAVLGAAFFGGLLLTVRALPDARRPGALAAVSFLGRVAVAAGGLLVAARAGLGALAGATGAMLLVRTWLIRRHGGPTVADGEP